MKSQTDNQMYGLNDLGNGNKWLMAALLAYALLWLGHGTANAQIASSNPLEYVALAEGNELINAQIKAQIEDEQKTALLQNTIAAEFTMIHSWEKKYNKYLKTAEGYASTLKACTSLYDDGVRVFINLCNLKKAITTPIIRSIDLYIIMCRAKTENCLIANDELPNLTARLGNFRFHWMEI